MPLRNAPSRSLAALSTIGSRLAGRIPRAPFANSDPVALEARLQPALAGTPDAELHCLGLPARPMRWHDSGVDVAAGEAVTLLAEGTVHLARALRVSLLPRSTLWYRIGDGPVQRAQAETCTITADRSGRLQLAAVPPGTFADREGTIERTAMHALLSGGLAVAIIRWHDSAEASLRAAARQAPDIFEAALRRHQQPATPPAGWHHLWKLGANEQYRAHEEDGCVELCCRTDSDVGILQYPVDVPLTPDLRLEWSWRADRLPSRVAEHIDLTHDYLSIAVEFDNGLDLTWMWSAAMRPGTVFQCPLPYWKERETHWVIRSQPDDPLGEWLDESRPIHDDYGIAIAEARPARVVAVWLIANSVFQRGVGECCYRDIRLVGEGRETRINLSR